MSESELNETVSDTLSPFAAELDHQLRQWLAVLRGGMEMVGVLARQAQSEELGGKLLQISEDGLHAADSARVVLEQLRKDSEGEGDADDESSEPEAAAD